MNAAAEPLAYVVTYNDGRPGMRQPLTGPSFSVGRDVTNDLCVLDDSAVSRQHCIIEVVGGTSLWLQDLQSRNGTYLNGTRMTDMAFLPIPSEVWVGNTRLVIEPAYQQATNVTLEIDVSHLSYDSITNIRIPASGFFRPRTEAYMVVDLIDSTSLIRQDDVSFAKVVFTMGRILERSLAHEPESFLKCTGDGYFACFGTPAAALRAGTRLAPALHRTFPVEVQVSVALHWGSAQLMAVGNDRTGRDVHAVFSLEQVRHQDAALAEEIRTKQTKELILMTEAFWLQLDDSTRLKGRPLGTYPLKGLESGASIYRWYGEGVQTSS